MKALVAALLLLVLFTSGCVSVDPCWEAQAKVKSGISEEGTFSFGGCGGLNDVCICSANKDGASTMFMMDYDGNIVSYVSYGREMMIGPTDACTVFERENRLMKADYMAAMDQEGNCVFFSNISSVKYMLMAYDPESGEIVHGGIWHTSDERCDVISNDGFDIMCGERPEGCLGTVDPETGFCVQRNYSSGDICTRYAACDIIGGECAFVSSPEFEHCRSCVEGCRESFPEVGNDLFLCEAGCTAEIDELF